MFFFCYPDPNGASRGRQASGQASQQASKQPSTQPSNHATRQASKQATRQASKQATKAPGQDSKKKKLLPNKGIFSVAILTWGHTAGKHPIRQAKQWEGRPHPQPPGRLKAERVAVPLHQAWASQAAGPATGQDSKKKKTFAASKVFFCLLS